jgi:hypothetical protein
LVLCTTVAGRCRTFRLDASRRTGTADDIEVEDLRLFWAIAHKGGLSFTGAQQPVSFVANVKRGAPSFRFPDDLRTRQWCCRAWTERKTCLRPPVIERCRIPELYESFYAVAQSRRFSNPLMSELLKARAARPQNISGATAVGEEQRKKAAK